MPTDEQKKRLWVAIETKRLSVEDRQTTRIQDGLMDAVQPVKQRLREQGVQDAIDDIESEINRTAIEEAYKDLYSSVGVSFAMDTFSGLISRKQDDTLEDIWMERLKEFATSEAGSRIVNVTQYTVEQVREVLDRGIKEGWGIEKVANELSKSKAISRTRARTISRTEIVSASNEGSLMGARSTRLNLRKEWLPTFDSRVRSTHAAMGGKDPIDIDEQFRVGGYPAEYPGDTSLPASEAINCRCAISFIPYD